MSDIYGETELIYELVDKFFNENFDIIVIAGGINNLKWDGSEIIFKKLLSIANRILFVPGGTDRKDMNTQLSQVTNIEKQPFLIEKNGLKVGFLGLGGVPDRSIKQKSEYPNIWNEGLWYNTHIRKLSVDYRKIELEKPDYILFVSHSPPYGIADYSRKITIKELEYAENIEEQDIEEEKRSTNPLHLGSRIIKEFAMKNKINLHLFGHVHQKGGEITKIRDTLFVNISHISVLPYKLTGRKICNIQAIV